MQNDLIEEAADYCEECNGPVLPGGLIGWVRDWICFRLVLVWPSRWIAWPLLPHAGSWAFGCSHLHKRRARKLAGQ
jgi:hypothetical protein